MAVCLLACWVRLFRRELLQCHPAWVEILTSCQGKLGLLGGAFKEGVTVIVGSTLCEAAIYIEGPSHCFYFHLLPLLSFLFHLHFPAH